MVHGLGRDYADSIVEDIETSSPGAEWKFKVQDVSQNTNEVWIEGVKDTAVDEKSLLPHEMSSVEEAETLLPDWEGKLVANWCPRGRQQRSKINKVTELAREARKWPVEAAKDTRRSGIVPSSQCAGRLDGETESAPIADRCKASGSRLPERMERCGRPIRTISHAN